MSFHLSSLKLTNYRNFDELKIQNFDNFVIFYGPNATGKTNIIEAIDILTSGKSFKKTKDCFLIKDIAESRTTRQFSKYSFIEGTLEEEKRIFDLRVLIKETKKNFFINEKEKKLQSYSNICPSVVFSPDDLQLIKSSNATRLIFFDEVGCLLSKNYQILKRDFNNVLNTRNKLLKSREAYSNFNLLLESHDDVYIICSCRLSNYRSALIKRFNSHLSNIYQEISQGNECLTCEFIPSWYENGYGENEVSDEENSKIWLQDALVGLRKQEFKRQYTIVGANRDKINFLLDNKDASKFASQGQQRSIVLAIKIAQILIIEEILHSRPILLLDDVMSELDDERRLHLTHFFKEDMQTFITTTHLDYFETSTLNNAQIIETTSLFKN